MKEVKEYLLPFSSLKMGKHHFDFQIDDAFFESYPESEIEQGSVKVFLTLTKQETLLQLDFEIEGSLRVVCDRCLEEFSFPIQKSERLIVKFGSDSQELSDDIIMIPYSETSLDLRQHLYEYIMLSLPMQRIHPDTEEGTAGCNPEIFQYLNTEDKTDKIDPRWNVLLSIKKEVT